MAASEAAGLHGDWETPQRSGTCFLRGTLVAVRYVLRKRCGWPVARVKRLMAAARIAFLDEAAAAMRSLAAAVTDGAGLGGSDGAARAALAAGQVCAGREGGCARPHQSPPPLMFSLQRDTVVASGALARSVVASDDTYYMGHAAAAFNVSDAALVRLAAKQTARALAKLVTRGHVGSIGAEPVAKGRAVVLDVLQSLERVCGALFGAAVGGGAEEVLGGVVWPLSAADDAVKFAGQGEAAGAQGGDTPFLRLALHDVAIPAARLRWPGFGPLTHLADDCSMFAGPLSPPGAPLNVSLLPLSCLPSDSATGAATASGVATILGLDASEGPHARLQPRVFDPAGKPSCRMQRPLSCEPPPAPPPIR